MFSMILFLVWFQRVFERRYFLSTYSLVSKDCALLLKTWIEDPFDIQNLSFTHDTTKKLLEISLDYQRSGSDFSHRLMFLEQAFMRRHSIVERNKAAFRKFSLHIISYLLCLLIILRMNGVSFVAFIGLYHIFYFFLLRRFIPEEGRIFHPDSLLAYFMDGLESFKPLFLREEFDSRLFELEVEKDIGGFERSSESLVSYLAAFEIIYLGPLLLFFSAYFLLTGKAFLRF